MINLAEIVNSVEFQEPIDIKVKTQNINDYGETEKTETTKKINAVILNGKNQYKLKQEYTTYSEFVDVYITDLTIKNVINNNTNDEIVFHDNLYSVLEVGDFSSFGFLHLVCGSKNTIGL